MDRVPGFFQIFENLGHNLVDQPRLHGRELAALGRRGPFPGSPEKDVHEGKNQFGLNDQNRLPPERIHPKKVQARRSRVVLNEILVLHRLARRGGYLDPFAQDQGQALPKRTEKFSLARIRAGISP